jgi:hypothetical protein
VFQDICRRIKKLFELLKLVLGLGYISVKLRAFTLYFSLFIISSSLFAHKLVCELGQSGINVDIGSHSFSCIIFLTNFSKTILAAEGVKSALDTLSLLLDFLLVGGSGYSAMFETHLSWLDVFSFFNCYFGGGST